MRNTPKRDGRTQEGDEEMIKEKERQAMKEMTLIMLFGLPAAIGSMIAPFLSFMLTPVSIVICGLGIWIPWKMANIKETK